MQDILRQAMEENFDEDAFNLAKAARVVRKIFFRPEASDFTVLF